MSVKLCSEKIIKALVSFPLRRSLVHKKVCSKVICYHLRVKGFPKSLILNRRRNVKAMQGFKTLVMNWNIGCFLILFSRESKPSSFIA